MSIPQRIILPKAVWCDQPGILLGDEQLIVVILRPLFGFIRLAEKPLLILPC